MKNYSILLILFSMLLSQTVAAQYDRQDTQEENNPYLGKWQEYERTYKKRGGDFADFQDTMQLQFMPDSTVRIWYSDGRYFNELYRFGRKGIRFGEKFSYDKHWLSENELILKGDNDFQHFKRVNNLKQGAIKKVIPGAEKGNVNLNPSHLRGVWSSYKKEDKAFSGKKYYMKTLEILEDDGRDNYKIKLSMANRADIQSFDGTMSVDQRSMRLQLKEETYVYEILKLENNEMILRRDGAIIYLKEFTR